MSAETNAQYDAVIEDCRKLFLDKMTGYGSSWLLFRLPAITDQIFIKAKRIRTLEDLQGPARTPEGRDAEYRGIINYCIIALGRLWFPTTCPASEELLAIPHLNMDVDVETLGHLYDQVVNRAKALMIRKNHDYGEAWRDMRLFSITDQIIVKLARLKNIENNAGRVLISEATDALYADIVNWCVFGLIKRQGDPQFRLNV